MNETVSTDLPLARRFNAAIFALALIGLWISSHLFWAKLKGIDVVGCVEGAVFNCNSVQNSRFSMFFGFPVSLLGAAGYAALAALCLTVATARTAESRAKLEQIRNAGASLGILFTMYLIAVMFFVIPKETGSVHLCSFCLMSAGTMLTIAILILVEQRKRKSSLTAPSPVPEAPALPSETELSPWQRCERFFFIGFAAIVISGVIGSKAYYEYLANIRPPPPPPRPVLDPRKLDAPAAHARGPKDSNVIFTVFANYECPHCRHAEPMLKSILTKYGTRIRFVSIFKHFDNRKYAMTIAETAEAVAAQNEDAFWKFHGAVMSSKEMNEQIVKSAVNSLGLDTVRIEQEVAEHKHAKRVDEMQSLCKLAGVESTPIFMVNRRVFIGPNERFGETWEQRQSQIEQEIESALSGSKH